MMNSLAKDNQHCLSFLNFCTKPYVQKRKCDAELLKIEWAVNSAGFKDDKKRKRKLSTSDTKTLPSKNFVQTSKVTRSPARESQSFSEPKLVRNKAHHISLNNLEDSTIEENLPKQNNHVSTKRFSSVFLEVQNIQSSFQRTKPDYNLKPVKLSSELAQKFKSEVLSKNAVRNNKIVQPQNLIKTKLLSLDSTRSNKKIRSDSELKIGEGIENEPQFQSIKSIKAFTERSKKLTTNIILKKKSVKQVFDNSFEIGNLDIKPKSAIPFKSAAVPSADLSHCRAAWKFKKINIEEVYSGDKDSAFRVAKKSPIESCLFAANSETNFESIPNVTSLKSNIDNEKSFAETPSRSEISHSKFSKLLETHSAGGKGSDWMHSLQPERDSEEKEQWKDPDVKNIRNIVTGGFAEQLLKLQRRESSEKSIWNHKIQKKNGRALKNSLCLILTSTSYTEELVIAKASLVADDESQTGTSLLSNNDNAVVVVFKRKAFAKMHLRMGDVFRLYQPWQTIHLPSVPHPVILCAYFIDVISRSTLGVPNEVVAVENIPVIAVQSSSSAMTGDACGKLLKKAILHEDATHGDMLFYRQKDLVTFSARVQRVWRKEFDKVPSSGNKYIRYSLLLQVRDGTFHELRVLPDTVPGPWYDVVSQSEGGCFRFHNLSVTHRTPMKSVPGPWYDVVSHSEGGCFRFHNLSVTHRVPMKRNKYLQDILKRIHQHNGGELVQEFCYQLMFDGSSEIPESIDENGFPDYYPIGIEPLRMFSRKSTLERLTCIVKVLLKHKNVIYVSDQSLLDSSAIVKYTQLHFLASSEHIPSLVGSTVLIKEALIEEDYLLIDNYSQLIPLSESSFAFHQLSPENKMQVKLQEAVHLKNVVPLLHMGSQVSDIVYIQGEIASVNESTAVTWVQCCFCLQDNLVQDMNLVIYCEDCSRIVPKPILNVQLEVLVDCQRLTSANVNIQLLSATAKRILEIPESTYQPQFSISDVLGKEIGPLYCCVQSCDVTSDKPTFHLSELDTS